MSSSQSSILEEAIQITSSEGERAESYGDARADMERVASFATAIMGHEIRPEQVPLFMIAVKLSRQVHKPKRDNLVDIAGWARIAELVQKGADR